MSTLANDKAQRDWGAVPALDLLKALAAAEVLADTITKADDLNAAARDINRALARYHAAAAAADTIAHAEWAKVYFPAAAAMRSDARILTDDEPFGAPAGQSGGAAAIKARPIPGPKAGPALDYAESWADRKMRGPKAVQS